KPILWYDQQVTPLQKAIEPYLPEWRQWPVRDMLADVNVAKICPTSAWTDAYLYGLEQYFAAGGCHIYVDMSSISACSNPLHGCGYIDDNGVRQSTIPVLKYREFMLTVQNALKSNDPDAAIGFHGVGINCLWSDQHIEGEYWQYAADYQTLTPEFYQLFNLTGHQIGSVGGIFAALIYGHVPGAQKSKVTQEDIIGLSLLHDAHVYNCHAIEIYGNVITTEPFLRFGADAPDCTWIPYWRNPLSHYPESTIAISSWKRGSRTLSVAFNTDAGKNADFQLPAGKNTDMIQKAQLNPGKVTLKPRSLMIFLNEQ
ncbi:MAG: hypothetical protein J6S21_02105, partial [Victivallales bacterium]|nr:hypothetical protein [Victivallales bacterium]